MYSWINSNGESIKTKTLAEFARKYDFPLSMARHLAAGMRSRLRGWCSTSKKPKVKKHRERFMTRLVNTKTGETAILGPSVKKFARDHGLSLQGLSELVNGHVAMYRGYMLQTTHELLYT